VAVNFEIPSRRVKVGKDGFFDVRGLNTEDLTHLTVHYLDDLKAAVAKYGRAGGAIPKDKMAEVLLDIAKDFPSMSSEIISRCADAPEDQAKFRNLPFVASLNALKAITELTVEDGGVELKNFLAGLVAMLEVNGIKLGPLGTQLKNTIEAVGRTSPS
jgi:hypothetical protein